MDWFCPECNTEYESQFGGLFSDSDCCVHLLPIDGCHCYKCEETRYLDDGSVKNNMEYHTYGEPCKDCGEPRTEYKDLGRKGRYVCLECN